MHKVMSQEQIAANRRNARLSTGPKTRAGKARSARNNTRHGLFSRFLFLTVGPDPENPAEFDALSTSLYAHFNLASPSDQYRDCEGAGLAYERTPYDLNHAMKCVLVYRLARLHWLSRRLARFEALAAAAQTVPGASAAQSNTTDLELAYFEHPSFLSLIRFESRIDRAIHHTLERLAYQCRDCKGAGLAVSNDQDGVSPAITPGVLMASRLRHSSTLTGPLANKKNNNSKPSSTPASTSPRRTGRGADSDAMICRSNIGTRNRPGKLLQAITSEGTTDGQDVLFSEGSGGEIGTLRKRPEGSGPRGQASRVSGCRNREL